ncbi:deazapurine DNA modification protein DpdA family protein [Nonomuraea jabiensis]|uniref:deazapurine DNA modification protein DpdA family protein n=1 Tax=Nonomuraea jabiensis TaxID=882448 RepID=UPI0036CE09E6
MGGVEAARLTVANTGTQDGTVFYLGTHHPHWLADERFRTVPLFVSSRRLRNRKTLPRAVGRWALDSGGFTEIKMYGRWTITPEQYAELVCWYARDIGMPDFIAPMDWMCEPAIICGQNQHLKHTDPRYFHGTRAARGIPPDGPDEPLDDAVRKHQMWTVANYLELRNLLPAPLNQRLIAVAQGARLPHYLDILGMYADAGVDLRTLPRVGLGSVCRRQHTSEIAEIVGALAARGLRNMHGFGVKTDGLDLYGADLSSADSQAWSDSERHRGYPRFPECVGVHKNCANCPKAALRWHGNVLARLARARRRPHQTSLFDPTEVNAA